MGGGTIAIGAGTTLEASGGFNVYAPLAFNGSFTLGGYQAFTLSGPATLNTAATITTVNPLLNQTLAGPISGTGSLTKSGPGELTLSAPSSYTGGTTVSGGYLLINAATALPIGGTLSISNSAYVNMNGFNLVLGGLSTSNGGMLVNSGGAATLYYNAATGAGTLPMVGATTPANLNLTMLGGSTLVVSATQMYTGGTNVDGGTLQMGVNQGINAASQVTIANAFRGGPATLALNGNSLSLNNGLIFGGTQADGTSQGNVTLGGGTLGFGSAVANVVVSNAQGMPQGNTISGGTISLASGAWSAVRGRCQPHRGRGRRAPVPESGSDHLRRHHRRRRDQRAVQVVGRHDAPLRQQQLRGRHPRG